MPEDGYPKQLFSQEWNVKPHGDRQRKTAGKVIDDIFVLLGVNVWRISRRKIRSSLASFLACVDNVLVRGNKLAMYKVFVKKSNAGNRLFLNTWFE